MDRRGGLGGYSGAEHCGGEPEGRRGNANGEHAGWTH
jgi:hypothetical protein